MLGHDAAFFGKSAADAAFDLLGNFGLQGEHVVELSIEVLGPDLLAVLGPDEIRADPDAVAGRTHARLKQIICGFPGGALPFLS